MDVAGRRHERLSFHFVIHMHLGDVEYTCSTTFTIFDTLYTPIQVCPNSSCVIIMIMALIRAWPEPEQKTNPVTTAPPTDVFDFDEDMSPRAK